MKTPKELDKEAWAQFKHAHDPATAERMKNLFGYIVCFDDREDIMFTEVLPIPSSNNKIDWNHYFNQLRV